MDRGWDGCSPGKGQLGLSRTSLGSGYQVRITLYSSQALNEPDLGSSLSPGSSQPPTTDLQRQNGTARVNEILKSHPYNEAGKERGREGGEKRSQRPH